MPHHVQAAMRQHLLQSVVKSPSKLAISGDREERRIGILPIFPFSQVTP